MCTSSFKIVFIKKISPIDAQKFLPNGYLRFFKNSQVFYRKQRAHDKDIEDYRVYIKITSLFLASSLCIRANSFFRKHT